MQEIEERRMSQEIAEQVCRTILSGIQVPEFSPEKIRVEDVALILGKHKGWVQAGIINGWLPIGYATLEGKLVTSFEQLKSNRRADYTIFPKKLWEVTGYIWTGRKKS